MIGTKATDLGTVEYYATFRIYETLDANKPETINSETLNY